MLTFLNEGKIHMNTNPTVCACVTHRFNASPKRVFDAWLDLQTAQKWLFID
jgi:uncharacterized protein YndB with AHSA1/START domain